MQCNVRRNKWTANRPNRRASGYPTRLLKREGARHCNDVANNAVQRRRSKWTANRPNRRASGYPTRLLKREGARHCNDVANNAVQRRRSKWTANRPNRRASGYPTRLLKRKCARTSVALPRAPPTGRQQRKKAKAQHCELAGIHRKRAHGMAASVK